MTQATLFPWRVGDAVPLARASDPLSSHRSAERVRQCGLIGTHEQRILAVLRATGQPMTAHEIGGRCRLTNVQVSRRMTAIESDEKNHVVKDETGRVCSVTGRRLETFQAKAQ